MAQDDIQGQVVDASGNPVEDAIVELTKSYQSSPTGQEAVQRTTTDANGNYTFTGHPDGDGTTQEWHVSAYNYDGSAYVNSFNNPGVTADLPELVIPDSVELRSHWDATESDTVTTDNGSVTGWDDLEGNIDLTGTATGIESINGNNAIRFDGIDDLLTGSLDADLNPPATVAATIEIQTVNSPDTLFFIDSTDNADSFIMYLSNTEWSIFNGNAIGGGSPDTNPHTWLGYFDDGTNSTSEVDDSTQVSGNAGTRNAKAGDTISIAARSKDADDRFLDVRVGEILFYDTVLDAETRSDVHNYLADKWGITI